MAFQMGRDSIFFFPGPAALLPDPPLSSNLAENSSQFVEFQAKKIDNYTDRNRLLNPRYSVNHFIFIVRPISRNGHRRQVIRIIFLNFFFHLQQLTVKNPFEKLLSFHCLRNKMKSNGHFPSGRNRFFFQAFG